MTYDKVKSILGEPLKVNANSQLWAPCEVWVYSEPPPIGTLYSSYWRRWVLFDNGTVVAVLNDYYYD